MQHLIKKIKQDFESQDIYYLKGKDKDNNELHFIRYFPTNNAIKNMSILNDDGLPCKMYFKNFFVGCNHFLSICEEVEIVYVMDNVVPLFNYIKNKDLETVTYTEEENQAFYKQYGY